MEVLSVIRVCRLCPLSVYPAGLPVFLSGGVLSVSTAASQKKGTVSYYFDPILRCPPLAALSDDRREEFKPRWQRSIGTK